MPGRDDRAGPDAPGEQLRALLGEIVRAVAGVDAVGVVERGADGRVRSRAASDPRARRLDEGQADRGEGPSVDALGSTDPAPLVVADVARESERRPEFAAAAAEAGLASVVCFPLLPWGAPPAAVTFYGGAAHAFDDPAVRGLAGALALEVATLLLGTHRTTALRRAHAPGDLLARAKGVVMERLALDDTGAFALLLKEAREGGHDLVDVACRLVEDAGAPPPVGTPAPASRWHDGRGDGSVGRRDRRDHLEQREALEDEREELAQHRDRLAEARETLADDREALADAREEQADRREAALAEREATVGQLAERAGIVDVDRLGRADEVLGRSHEAVQRMGENVIRSRAALTRMRELYAREQEEIDRETLGSARSAAESGDDPAGPSGGRVGGFGGGGPAAPV